MKTISLILLVILPYWSFSQSTYYVVDAETREPIPLAEVSDETGSTYLTDWDGKADFQDATSSVEVHSLGYVDSVFVHPMDTLWMRPSHTLMNEMYVYSGDLEPDTVLGNPSEEDDFSFRVGKSFETPFRSGLLIEIDNPTVLYSVSFYVSRRSKRHSYYRFRLLKPEFDGDTVVAFADIIDSSLIGQLDCRRCWQKIELPGDVLVSEDVLVTMEWVPEPGWEPEEDDDEVELHDMACAMSQSGYSCSTYSGTEHLIPRCFEWMPDHVESDQYNMALYVDANILD